MTKKKIDWILLRVGLKTFWSILILSHSSRIDKVHVFEDINSLAKSFLQEHNHVLRDMEKNIITGSIFY